MLSEYLITSKICLVTSNFAALAMNLIIPSSNPIAAEVSPKACVFCLNILGSLQRGTSKNQKKSLRYAVLLSTRIVWYALLMSETKGTLCRQNLIREFSWGFNTLEPDSCSVLIVVQDPTEDVFVINLNGVETEFGFST